MPELPGSTDATVGVALPTAPTDAFATEVITRGDGTQVHVQQLVAVSCRGGDLDDITDVLAECADLLDGDDMSILSITLELIGGL